MNIDDEVDLLMIKINGSYRGKIIFPPESVMVKTRLVKSCSLLQLKHTDY